MPILENPRHELFAQELAKGKSAHEAYISAGYKPSRKNAARLRTKEDVKTRLAELQAATAQSTKITIQSICAELDAATQVAKQKGQAAAMVSASALRAKLGGLMIDKVEVGSPGEFSNMTSKQVIEVMIEDLIKGGCIVDSEARAQFVALIDRCCQLHAGFKASLPKVRTTGFRVESQAERSNGQRQITLRPIGGSQRP
jgi:hypothetical protein